MGIFSTYSQNENRVTSTILAVLEELHQKLVALILQRLTEDDNLPFLKYTNQPHKKNSTSIPDGHIEGLFSYYIETKVKKDAYEKDHNQSQLKNHLEGYVEKMPEGVRSALIVITSDNSKPKFIKQYETKNLCYWANFYKLIEIIDEILSNKEDILQYILTNRETYLLNELKNFISECPDLLPYDDYTKRVIVIANKDFYYRLYKEVGCCIWQPRRFFQKSAYMAFYADNRIREIVPRILGYIDSMVDIPNKRFDENEIVIFDEKIIKKDDFIKRLHKICDFLASDLQTRSFQNNKIILLSKENDDKTITLGNEVKNDLTSSSGRRTAFTMGQPRYVNLDTLKRARTTQNLRDGFS